MKRRLAIWTPGGVGGGHFNQGYPKIMEILGRLAVEYEITVYTSVSVDLSTTLPYVVVTPPTGYKAGITRWIFLWRQFRLVHKRDPFQLLISFWAYPSGTISVCLAKWYRLPSVVMILGGDVAYVPSIGYGLLVRYFYRKVVLWTCRNATELVSVSSYQTGVLKRFGMKRVPRLIPWGVDKAEFRAGSKFTEQTVRFLHVGNLTEVKDQATLLKAFAIFARQRDAVLRVVGPDYMNGKIHQIVNDLGISDRVTFTGPVPYRSTREHYAWGDIYLLTSLSEGQNLTLTEAAMSGLLLAGTPVGAANDIGGEGVVMTTFGNAEMLSAELISVLDKPGQRNKMIERSLAWARAHDFEWTIGQLKDLINRVARKPRVAFIGVGMVGTGIFNQGIPAFTHALEEMSAHCAITIYSFIPVNKQTVPTGIRVRSIRWQRLHQRLQYLLLGLFLVVDHLRRKYSIIHVQSPFPAGVLANRLSKALHVKWVLSLHAGETTAIIEHNFGDLLKPGRIGLTRNLCSKSDVLTAMSAYQAEITRINLRINRDIEVLTRGVQIVIDAIPEKVLGEKLSLIYVANYHPVKDIFMLLRTFKRIRERRDAELVIIGNNYDELRRDSNEADFDKDIKWEGAMEHEKVIEALRGAHILLHTSFYEALPMVALEAMAEGVAVCGTHVGILADTSGVCCLTVMPGDDEALAEQVISLTRDQGAYDALRTRAFNWAREHAVDKYVSRLFDIYDKARSS